MSSSAAAATSLPPWTRPTSEFWAPFEMVVIRLVDEFDVVNRLVDEAENGDVALNRITDDLLYNFSERWIAGKPAPIDVLCDFFVGAFEDHFGAEVEDSVMYPLARVLSTIFEECKNGILKGAQYVLSKPRTHTPRVRREDDDDGEEMEEEEQRDAASPAAAGGGNVANGGQISDVEMKPAEPTPSTEESTPGPDADGWETVAPKSNRKRKQG